MRYMQIKTGTLVHNAYPQVYPLLPETWGITLAWAHCSQLLNNQNLYKNRYSQNKAISTPKPLHRLNFLIC